MRQFLVDIHDREFECKSARLSLGWQSCHTVWVLYLAGNSGIWKRILDRMSKCITLHSNKPMRITLLFNNVMSDWRKSKEFFLPNLFLITTQNLGLCFFFLLDRPRGTRSFLWCTTFSYIFSFLGYFILHCKWFLWFYYFNVNNIFSIDTSTSVHQLLLYAVYKLCFYHYHDHDHDHYYYYYCCKWFEPSSISSSYCVIVHARVVLKRTCWRLILLKLVR